MVQHFLVPTLCVGTRFLATLCVRAGDAERRIRSFPRRVRSRAEFVPTQSVGTRGFFMIQHSRLKALRCGPSPLAPSFALRTQRNPTNPWMSFPKQTSV